MDSSDSDTSTKKKYKCTVAGCKATFSKNRKLVTHTRKHNGEVSILSKL